MRSRPAGQASVRRLSCGLSHLRRWFSQHGPAGNTSRERTLGKTICLLRFPGTDAGTQCRFWVGTRFPWHAETPRSLAARLPWTGGSRACCAPLSSCCLSLSPLRSLFTATRLAGCSACPARAHWCPGREPCGPRGTGEHAQASLSPDVSDPFWGLSTDADLMVAQRSLRLRASLSAHGFPAHRRLLACATCSRFRSVSSGSGPPRTRGQQRVRCCSHFWGKTRGG